MGETEKDRTGLCTVRDTVAFMFKEKADVMEMCFWHEGKEWNVELRILTAANLLHDPVATATQTATLSTGIVSPKYQE